MSEDGRIQSPSHLQKSAPKKPHHQARQGQSNNTDDEEPSNKRRRIALACKNCRTRKSRCDGARPKCSLCKDLGFECIYVQNASSSNVIIGKEYLSSLEDRVGSIESTLTQFQIRMKGFDQALRDSPRANGAKTGTQDDGDKVLEPDPAFESDQIEEVFALGDGVSVVEKETGFFGPSSNVAFLRHISKAFNKVKQRHDPGSTPSSLNDGFEGGLLQISGGGASSKELFKAQQIDTFALPSREETQKLIDRYFADPGFLYPFLHKPTFEKKYLQMRDRPPKEMPRAFIGVLNMIMTIATATMADEMNTPGAVARTDAAETFFKRGMKLCERAMVRGSSLEIVQFLLLACMYLQGSQKTIEAWTLHGLAVKAALQLGLHAKELTVKFEPIEMELRRRAFFGCVVLDRTLSMSFGRPAALPESYVRLSPAQPFLDGSLSPSSLDQKSTAFLNASVELYRHAAHAIDQLYGFNLGCESPPSIVQCLPVISGIDTELHHWTNTLPHHLRIQTSEIAAEYMTQPLTEPLSTSSERLSFLLTIRYHNTRLLLHRPVLNNLLDIYTSNDQYLSTFPEQSRINMQIMFDSASEIILMVSAAILSRSKKGMLGAWWFTTYYTFNAALVICSGIFVCRHENANKPLIDTHRLAKGHDCIFKAITALSRLDTGNVLIDHCVAFLRYTVKFLAPSSPTNPSVNPTPNQATNSSSTTTTNPSLPPLFPPAPPSASYNVNDHDLLPVYDAATHGFQMDFGPFMMPGDVNEWMNPTPTPNSNPYMAVGQGGYVWGDGRAELGWASRREV